MIHDLVAQRQTTNKKDPNIREKNKEDKYSNLQHDQRTRVCLHSSLIPFSAEGKQTVTPRAKEAANETLTHAPGS
jgi:hypothetical protein